MLPKFAYVRASTVEEATQNLAANGAKALAGGSDLLGCLRDGVFETPLVVSISGLSQLKGINRTRNGGLRIGAMTRVAEVAADPTINELLPGLAQAASVVASPQLRNQGTMGGNLCQKPRCWYYRGEFNCRRKGGSTCFAMVGENEYHCLFGGALCYIVHPSDTAPILTALEATLSIAGPRGTRSVPLSEFYVLPEDDATKENVLEQGEFVTEVTLPEPAAGLRTSYRKERDRGAWDFSLAGVALAMRMDGGRVSDARVVLSGAAPVPWRSREAEQVIEGQRINAAVAAEAAEAAMADARPLGKNGYKITMFKGIIEEELLAIGGA
jgi:xanthine dehydrogenase YagS FAD-binding subunit